MNTVDQRGIPQTSISDRSAMPGEVAVRFLKWTPFGPTAYMKDQVAGFSQADAAKLIRGGYARAVNR